MNIIKTTALTWHISDDEHEPLGIVDKDGDQFVAMRHGCDVIAVETTLEAAAASLA